MPPIVINRYAILLLLVCVSACSRAGFATSDDRARDAAGDAPASRDLDVEQESIDQAGVDIAHDLPRADAPQALLVVTSAHDTCEAALDVDLSGVQQGPVTFAVDTAGAADDYALTHCNGQPEVVVRLLSSPGGILTHYCRGGGWLDVVAPDVGCPGGAAGLAESLPCVDQNAQSVSFPSGTTYLVLCRDPQAGPATFTISTSFP